MTRSEEGFSGDDADGPLILTVDGVDVRESTWAGAYYCAHVLWLASGAAGEEATTLVRDGAGDPLVGFLHVPADAETTGHPGRARFDRHRGTARVVACALAGILDELRGRIASPRVLLTGFGPFAAVVSNPTGDFVEHDESVAHALALAAGMPAQRRPDLAKLAGDGAQISAHVAGDVLLARLRLDVDDVALHPTRPGSLPWALARVRPHALVALGVHRASNNYRVELEPTNAGLAGGHPPRHERGRPIDARRPHNRALARAIARGAARLGVS